MTSGRGAARGAPGHGRPGACGPRCGDPTLRAQPERRSLHPVRRVGRVLVLPDPHDGPIGGREGCVVAPVARHVAVELVPPPRPFARGSVPCTGQRCQKHPSTNTATRCRRKTMSARHRSPRTGASCLRKRNPRRCISDRSAASGAVSAPRLASIVARAAGEEAEGVEGLMGAAIRRDVMPST